MAVNNASAHHACRVDGLCIDEPIPHPSLDIRITHISGRLDRGIKEGLTPSFVNGMT